MPRVPRSAEAVGARSGVADLGSLRLDFIPASGSEALECDTFFAMDDEGFFTAGGVEIRIEDFTDADEFRSKYGRPQTSDPEVLAVWEATLLPAPGPLRRRAAAYLHELQTGTCGICLTPIDLRFRHGHPGHVEIDHIRPTSVGGDDVWANVRATHASCNSERGDGWHELSPLAARAVLERKMREVRVR